MASVSSLLAGISGIGRDQTRGGYSRPVYSTAELDLRSWFVSEAQLRGLDVRTDRNGIIWAWWGPEQDDSLVTGSHLDSVPGGGAFDGPLGVAAALAAVDELKTRGVTPGDGARSLAVTVFPEEEGSRFGIACLGSRLLSGAIDADKARNLRDADGNSFAELSAQNGINPEFLGTDPEALARIGQFIELHVEQGKGLIDLDGAGSSWPTAIGGAVLGHGRWKFAIRGQGNHAGTTLMADRADPMVAAAQIVLAAQKVAAEQPEARATVGRIVPIPGGTNVIASSVELWLDARHPDDAVTAAVVQKIHGKAQIAAANEGCSVFLTEESLSPTVGFDVGLQRRLMELLPGSPVLDTGAGYDAGIFSSLVPAGMVFIRNPSGISHSPEEAVEDADADLSAKALADVLEGLL
ncbi:formiminoglutamase [Renibacterium salmoninarum ATCC 33209]|uniref:Formiminoglutamase n=1 Tax=Renibacterium salmoninarum (strain ATCC 33209 / DSM 20767 / JCM 11484 / NBRC 15589 / NCIMB 2235) TaxID=288705 RepID=A9WN97_RENSM|nr:allantoate amidohydrolase [Renibacterium salmoninarum]ABY23060.1 formiminoglutamase [Renibacterium salmoninarum ATCC 33209]